MRRITICSGDASVQTVICIADDQVLMTAMNEPKLASAIVSCAKASLLVAGQDANGDVTFSAAHGGEYGNDLSISMVAGATGVGQEDRAMSASRTGMEILVIFGTDNAGDSVVPTAAEVANLINSDDGVSSHMVAEAGGTGAGLVNTTAATNLSGGLNNGDWIRPPFDLRACLLINSNEAVS